jgi:cytochrome c peroxidase
MAILLGCGDGASVGPEETDLRTLAIAAGLAPMPEAPLRPADNPYSQAVVELGHLLFFDPILSGPRDVACSTCHLPRFALADGRQFPSGAGATGLGPDRTDPSPSPLRLMPRNSPTVMNVGMFGRTGPEPAVNGMIFWSGSAFGLEDQVLLPIVADNELRGLTFARAVAVDSVLARLRAIPEYRERFAAAFPDMVAIFGADPLRVISAVTLRRALAGCLRELNTPDAPIDRFLRGDDDALTAVQKEGLALFIGRAGCADCHRGPLLSDFHHYVIGARQVGIGRDTTPGDDLGWGEHGGTPYSFRTAPLRQVAETSPYLHAGTAETLEDVIRFKNRGLSEHPRVTADVLYAAFQPLGLNDGEVAAIVAFLHALTDAVTPLGPLFNAPPRVPSGLEIPQ